MINNSNIDVANMQMMANTIDNNQNYKMEDNINSIQVDMEPKAVEKINNYNKNGNLQQLLDIKV